VSRVATPTIGVLLAALVATQHPDARPQLIDVERHINMLVAQMTVEEKFGQLQQLDGLAEGAYRPEHLELARRGLLGSTLNVRGAATVNSLQRVAVDESRLHIPLIFAFDVIHGYRTIFPIPLGQAAAWDSDLVERAAAISAAEARSAGVAWTFAPMVDIARDPRWGRIAEGAGEDPWLGAALARAAVRGFQGRDCSQPDRVVACAKHWVGYGAAEGGRDYNTTDIPERTLRSVYFPPFRAAVDAGVGTIMSGFNDLNGVPASANPFTLTDVLRREWNFDGVVVSDYRSVVELINHGIAADEADAARLALNAGVDMEMVSRSFAANGPRLVREGRISARTLEEAVRRVLRIKLRAGLFEHPYADETREHATLLKPEFRSAAREIAARTVVLLKNDRRTLPLSPTIARLAVIGSLADDRASTLGNWTGDGRQEDTVTVLEGVRRAVSPQTTVVYARGFTLDVGRMRDPVAVSDGEAAAEAVRVAQSADGVLLVLGETGEMSGEAASRASLDLPEGQLELAKRIIALDKPVVVVLMNGRPLAIPWLAEHAPAILEAWLPGTEGGNAIADVVFGMVSPGGKLPVSVPRTVGQVPIYYNHMNTGRPPRESDKYTSKYLDARWTPLYPFGYGLSYTTFRLSDLKLSAPRIRLDGTIGVSVAVANTGTMRGEEVVQLYLRQVVASVTRPVLELKGFRRIMLQSGERRVVEFSLGPDALGFCNRDMKWAVESGRFNVRVGTSSDSGLEASFEVADR
jgi:beta-glucosidase